jgi:hypothetical protein
LAILEFLDGCEAGNAIPGFRQVSPEVASAVTSFITRGAHECSQIALACPATKSVHVTAVDSQGKAVSILDKAIMIEVESLRRASGQRYEKYAQVFQQETRSRHREHLFGKIVWRLQALAEGGLTERAYARACEIANEADSRVIAPRDFVTVDGERVEGRSEGNEPQQCDRTSDRPREIPRL